MKKSILSVFMLTMFLLLSCNFDVLSELIDKASAKLSDRDKNLKNLKYGEEEQEGHQDGGEENLKELENNIKNFAEEAKLVDKVVVNKGLFGSVDPINEVSVVNQDLYPYQRPIQIKKENLVPGTNEEKEAEKAIKAIEGILKDSGFFELIDDARQLKSEYEQLKSSFYEIFSELQNKRNLLTSTNRNDRLMSTATIRELTSLQNSLNEEGRAVFDTLRIQVDVGLGEIMSAKGLFEISKNTLKEAITRRLRNGYRRNYSLRRESNLLAIDALSKAENVLNQLESSFVKINEAKVRKKDIEELIENAKSYLRRSL